MPSVATLVVFSVGRNASSLPPQYVHQLFKSCCDVGAYLSIVCLWSKRFPEASDRLLVVNHALQRSYSPEQDCEVGVTRSRKSWGGVGFLRSLGFGVGVLSDSGGPIESFYTCTPKFELVQFLLKLLLKQNFCCAPRFPLRAVCHKIVDNQTSFMLC